MPIYWWFRQFVLKRGVYVEEPIDQSSSLFKRMRKPPWLTVKAYRLITVGGKTKLVEQ